MKTYSAKPSDVTKGWYVVDAEDVVLGRLAAVVASRLRGKHKPMFTPNIDCGDNIIVVNAEKVRVTGKKLSQKLYHRHSGYPGGLKSQTLTVLLEKTPTRAIRHAVKGMLPKSRLGKRMLSRLKLYAGAEHPHAAQVNARPKAEKKAAPVPAGPAAETGDGPTADAAE